MQHGNLLARVLFSGDARRGLSLQRTGRLDRNLGVVEGLHDRVAGGLVALLAFRVGVGANLVHECLRRVTASGRDTRQNRDHYRRCDRTRSASSMGSESAWHVRIVSRTSSSRKRASVLAPFRPATLGGRRG